MDLELYEKLRSIKEKSNNDYIIHKLKNIRGNDDVHNITSEEVNLIIDLIIIMKKKDILDEKYETKNLRFLIIKINI